MPLVNVFRNSMDVVVAGIEDLPARAVPIFGGSKQSNATNIQLVQPLHLCNRIGHLLRLGWPMRALGCAKSVPEDFKSSAVLHPVQAGSNKWSSAPVGCLEEIKKTTQILNP